MLQNIHVKNMALIDEADVDFGGHLNILTGETGAGKSIIIGSISTALGGKVSRDVIRKDAEYALVELNFKVNSPQILAELEKMEIPVDGDEVVISRRITGSRSVARINGELVSLPVLRQAAALLTGSMNISLFYIRISTWLFWINFPGKKWHPSKMH